MVSHVKAELGGGFHWKMPQEVLEMLILGRCRGGMPWGGPSWGPAMPWLKL